VVALPDPPGGTSAGQIDHFWSIGFTSADGVGPYLPPSVQTPWFLAVVDGGFINTTGRITSFSLFVNDLPGSETGITYATNHEPMPQPTYEGGLVAAVVWIPEVQATAVAVAAFGASVEDGAVRIALRLARESPGARATVYRSSSETFESRVALTADPLSFIGSEFVYRDVSATGGVRYHYWVLVHEVDGSSFMNGPVSAMVGAAVTFAAPPRPNPAVRGATFEYAVGADVAGHGPVAVSLRLYDLQGRQMRLLRDAPQGQGQYRVDWDGLTDDGRRLAAGVYLMRLQAGTLGATCRLIVVD
jgi:hypothetical protein